MNYVSTRGGVEPVDFAEAVMMGLGTDGGLLVPAEIPTVDPDTLRRLGQPWTFRSWPWRSWPPSSGTTSPGRTCGTDRPLLRQPSTTGGHPGGGGGRYAVSWSSSTGPPPPSRTWPCSCWAICSSTLLERDGGRINIVGATSGDTGSAAISGVRGKARIEIFILHPKGRVSPIQERQMTTVLDANVHNLALRGTFDDAQRIVKALFNDLDFKGRVPPGGGQFHQLGADPGPDRLLLLRLGPGERRRPTTAGELRGAHRQLRRLSSPAIWPSAWGCR